MIVTFTYPLPDELYVQGVSGKVKGTFTYDGPESITVNLDSSGSVLTIEPNITSDMDPNLVKTINPEKDPASAYLLDHYFLDILPWEYKYEDVIMENGDIYKKQLNPNLTDAYELFYNFEKDEWELKQILKELFDPAIPVAKERKEYILKYYDNYAFSKEIEKKIENYLVLLQDIIDNPNLIETWKYIELPTREVPKIPADIIVEISKLTNIEV